MKKEDQIVQTLIKAKKAYYEGTPLMSDEEFDEIEDQLRKSDPDNDYFKLVGSPIVKGAKIKHEVAMLSCQKAKVIADIVKWLNKISDKRLSLLIEPKIDSLSGDIKYVNGVLSHIATRGDGEVGQDITHIKDYLNIPKTLPNNLTIEVRGEIYLPKNNTVPNPKNKPLRNIAVGLINRKEHTEDHKQLRFVAYQIVNSENVSEEEDLVQLKHLGFHTFTCTIVNAVNKIEEYYKFYLDVLRERWEFETDGLVIVVNDKELQKDIDSRWVVEHHHHYNIAYKPPSEEKDTVLLGIDLQVSRQGSLIPVGILRPVVIGGATITRVSLHNYKTVIDNNLKQGDVVTISRANDVIPYYVATKESGDGKPFSIQHCPSCGGSVKYEGVHAICPNNDCPEKVIQGIVYWVEQCEMDQVAESTIRTLYNENIVRSIHNLYSLKKKNLEKLDGFGEKKIDNLISQIDKSTHMTIVQFLNRLGIPSVGEKAIKKMGIKSMDDFWNYKSDGSSIGDSLVKFRDSNTQYIQDLASYLDIDNEVVNIFSKGNVCMTGSGPKGRKELIKDIEALGYSFVDSINKDTNILLCEDVNSGSSKLQKATKLGVRLMTYQEFFK